MPNKFKEDDFMSSESGNILDMFKETIPEDMQKQIEEEQKKKKEVEDKKSKAASKMEVVKKNTTPETQKKQFTPNRYFRK